MMSSGRCVRWPVCGAIVAITLLVACSQGSSAPDAPSLPEVPLPPSGNTPAQASANAYGWLKSQMVSTGLVDSYQDQQDVCYTYDQAVAAIAFQAKGDAANARKVLDALASMQYANGSFNTAYFCTTKTVQEAQRIVGPVLWVALAVAYYEKKTGDLQYHAMGDKAVQWSLGFQQPDGGLNGGLDFNSATLTWSSTEHNEDAYAALTLFGYTASADKVKAFLDNKVWDAPNQRWQAGRNDPTDPMDVNAWGVSALGGTGTRDYRKSLEYVMAHHRSAQTQQVGASVVTVDGFDFDSNRNDIWFEGTGQMIVAFRVLGGTSDIDYFIPQLMRGQQSDGGVQYSLKGTNNGYWTMSTAKSVAASGWLIFAIDGVNPFKP